MEYINLHTATLDSEAFQDAEPQQRSTWLCLLRFCVGQENGGRIKEAAAFDDRKWLRLARVTREEAHSDCRLWHWRGSDLIVEFYPLKSEAQVKQNRANGSTGGKQRAANASSVRRASASSGLASEASSAADSDASTKRKEKEGKVKEGNEREALAHSENASSDAPEAGGESVSPPSHIPDEGEFREGFMSDGIPPEYLAQQFTWFASSPKRWLDRGDLVDWRFIVRRRWAQDRAGWSPGATFPPTGGSSGSASEKNGRGPSGSVAQQKFEMDREIRAIEAELDERHELNQPLPEGLRERLRILKQKRKELS